MLRQSENNVTITGLLSEIDVRSGEFSKNNIKMPYLSAELKIKVKQDIYGTSVEMEVPVSMFATKYTNSGTENFIYKSIEDIRDNFVSIAAGGVEKADYVQVRNATITENAFYDRGGNLISYPRITGSFINKVNRAEIPSEASFIGDFIIGNITEEVNTQGDVTGRLVISGIVSQYRGAVDVVKFIVSDERAVTAIQSGWNNGDNVRVSCLLNFSSTTEWFEEATDFGDSIRTPKTISIREIIIRSGRVVDIEYDNEELNKAIAERKVRLEETKNKPANKTKTNANNIGDSANANKVFNNLGF